jgi:hypothetical protein
MANTPANISRQQNRNEKRTAHNRQHHHIQQPLKARTAQDRKLDALTVAPDICVNSSGKSSRIAAP